MEREKGCLNPEVCLENAVKMLVLNRIFGRNNSGEKKTAILSQQLLII